MALYLGSNRVTIVSDGTYDAQVPDFTDVLAIATDTDGTTIYNGIGYLPGARFSSLGTGTTTTTTSYYMTTGFIPIVAGDTFYTNDLTFSDVSETYAGIVLYDSNRSRITSQTISAIYNNISTYYVNGYAENEYGCHLSISSTVGTSKVAYMRLVFSTSCVGDRPMISVNEQVSFHSESSHTNRSVNLGGTKY